MGYTTEFEGSISINPPLPSRDVKRVNEFCEERHGGPTQEYAGCPSFWCDWVVSDDGTKIGWNGNEKSYEMDKWLPILIERFFKPRGCTLNGELIAQGEDGGDVWKLKVENNKVKKVYGRISFEEE